jgi:hypothetical protein
MCNVQNIILYVTLCPLYMKYYGHQFQVDLYRTMYKLFNRLHCRLCCVPYIGNIMATSFKWTNTEPHVKYILDYVVPLICIGHIMTIIFKDIID